MPIVPFTALACPLDGLPLAAEDLSFRCPRGHSFDRARESYVNLLGSQHKSSSDPGDSREMVQARKQTLDAGLYEPLAAALTSLTMSLLPPSRFRIVDAGCGEGYYLDRMAGTGLSVTGATIELAGFDISKWAVRAAAKRNADIAWIVANNRYPPFTGGSIGLILCLFGFPVYGAFGACQPPGGRILLADPGPQHLIELRRVIYEEVRQSGPPDLQPAFDHRYRLEGERTVSWEASLTSSGMIDRLLRMTPHYFRMSQAARARLASIELLSVTMDVHLRLLIKNG